MQSNFNGINDLLARQLRDRVIRDDPFDATVRGNQLEEPPINGCFLEPHLGAFAPGTGWGFERVKRLKFDSLLVHTNRLLFRGVKNVQPAR